MTFRKPLPHLAALAACTFLLTGCPGGGTSGGGGGGSAKTLTTATSDDLSSVDPAMAFDTWSTSVVHASTRRLVDYDAEGKLVGDLAEKWQESDGGKTLTFTLRPDGKFADGSPIQAAHFKAALERVRDPKVASPGAGFYAGIESIEASEPLTLVIRLKQPDPTFVRVLGMTFAAPWKDGDDPRRPTSSGPYRVAEYAPGSRVVLERNPNDTKNPSGLEKIVLQLNVAQPLQWTRLRSGELDLLPGIPPAEYKRVKQDPAEQDNLVQGVVNQTWYFGMNTTKAPWNDARVRRAALLALNRERLVGIGGPGELANGILPPHVPGYNPERKLPAQNVAEAKRLLAEAGFASGTPKTVMWLANNEQYQRKAELIQADLAAVGIPVELRPVVFSEYRTGYRTKADCWYGGWYPDFPDAGNFLEPVLHGSNIGPGKSNAARYNNPAFNRLLDQAHGTPEGPQREALYRKAEDLLMQDLPWIPLTFEVETRYFRDGVTGVTVHPVWRQMLTGIDKR